MASIPPLSTPLASLIHLINSHSPSWNILFCGFFPILQEVGFFYFLGLSYSETLEHISTVIPTGLYLIHLLMALPSPPDHEHLSGKGPNSFSEWCQCLPTTMLEYHGIQHMLDQVRNECCGILNIKADLHNYLTYVSIRKWSCSLLTGCLQIYLIFDLDILKMHDTIRYLFASTLFTFLHDVCTMYFSGSLDIRNPDKLAIYNSLIPRVGRHLHIFI